MFISLVKTISLAAFCTWSFFAFGQSKIISSDTLVKKTDYASRQILSAPKPYREVIDSTAITSSGFLKVHKVEERYYFEIPRSLLNQNLLVTNRIIRSSAEGRGPRDFGFPGDEISENIIHFSKGPGNRIFLNVSSFWEQSTDTSANGLYHSLINANLSNIAAAFDIKAYSPVDSNIVVELTKYLNDDEFIFLNNSGFETKSKLPIESLLTDRSYIEQIRAFPLNVEVHTIKTYRRIGALGFNTYEFNTSLVVLPEVPMQARFSDNRVGYFQALTTDFDSKSQSIQPRNRSMITRWRLEPQREDIERYLRGELVEPQKPIVFYIDPTTPKRWIPYLILGINDWQKAFEKAGFKNAIYGMEAPVIDSTWSLEDARHNAIVYKPSVVQNASGLHIHDPRSGEILESHINWYHNVMQLLHDWYFIQAAAIDPKARQMEFDDSLMGELIRFVASHEVGHALGLTHNFGSSSTVPVDSLRNKVWLEKNGHTPSIMDYARFNYVAQPEDSISEKEILPRIGPYDEWAIEWGYRWFPQFKTPEEEKKFLSNWISARLGGDKRLWFGSEVFVTDPRIQSEDLGDDAIKAGNYGIMNLKREMSNLVHWTTQPGGDYEELQRTYRLVIDQFKRYLFHAATNVGGFMRTEKMAGEKGPVIEYPRRQLQRSAIGFLNDQLFNTPDWILNKHIYSLTGTGGFYELIGLQKAVLERLLSNTTLSNLLWAQTYQPGSAYTSKEFLQDLGGDVWSELKTPRSIDLYRRNLQKIYVQQLISLLHSPQNASLSSTIFYEYSTYNDLSSLIKSHIRSLITMINAATKKGMDSASQSHLIDVKQRLENELEPRK